MNEAETCAKLIDPALKAAVWGRVAEPRDVFIGFQKYLYATQEPQP